MVALDIVDRTLIAEVRPFVGIVARNVAEDPVARRAAPAPRAGECVGAVERSIRCYEASFDTRVIRERRLIQSALRLARAAQEILATVQPRCRKDQHSCAAEQKVFRYYFHCLVSLEKAD